MAPHAGGIYVVLTQKRRHNGFPLLLVHLAAMDREKIDPIEGLKYIITEFQKPKWKFWILSIRGNNLQTRVSRCVWRLRFADSSLVQP